MTDDFYRSLLDERHEQMLRLLTEVRDKITAQNGRVGTLETKVAVLEDRSPGRTAALSAGLISGVITGVAALLDYLMGHR